MKSIWETPFVVVDIESTGSNIDENRLIDLACVTVLDGEIISTYKSLVNPHQFIPDFIAKMTGISNEMAFKAPEPMQILTDVSQILTLPDAVFTAHNARFDYNFLNNSLVREGLSKLQMPRLCTLKLSRRILKKDIKKNVGSLAKFFNIPMRNRHRAFGDAFATAQILIELLEQAEQEHGISTTEELLTFQNKPIRNYRVPAKVQKNVEPFLENLPKESGVYYFKDKPGKILYVGKAKSLNDRVKSYFHNGTNSSRKISKLLKIINSIEWQITSSELSALILESKEIKRHKPPYNTIDKKFRRYPLIKIAYNNEFPILETTFSVEDDDADYYGPFRSISLAEEILNSIGKQFRLRKCAKQIKSGAESKPCFYYHIKSCMSPCSGKADGRLYTEELQKVKHYLSGFSDGILKYFENQMYSFAESMEYEKADLIKQRLIDLRRIFDRAQELPTSINENNTILVVPRGKDADELDVFFIKAGKLLLHKTIEKNTPARILFELISSTYYNGHHRLTYTEEDIDEIKIISSWMYRKKQESRSIAVNGKTADMLTAELFDAIKANEEDVSYFDV